MRIFLLSLQEWGLILSMVLITNNGNAVQLFDLRFVDDSFHNHQVLIKACVVEPDYRYNPKFVYETIGIKNVSSEQDVKDARDDFAAIVVKACSQSSFIISGFNGWRQTY